MHFARPLVDGLFFGDVLRGIARGMGALRPTSSRPSRETRDRSLMAVAISTGAGNAEASKRVAFASTTLEASMRIVMSMLALAALGLAAPSWAASDAECRDSWKKADANADGVLSDRESVRYVALMRIGDRTVATEGRITQAEFMDACKADVFSTRQADEGAPLKGANSFTEGQAKDRALASGLNSVSTLNKDGDGIWRGTAMRDGKTVKVAIDFKGNVVSE
jgi:hypothetical protein